MYCVFLTIYSSYCNKLSSAVYKISADVLCGSFKINIRADPNMPSEKMKMKKIFYFAITLALWALSYAATPISYGKAVYPAMAATPSSTSQADLELKILEKELLTMRDYHSSLLDTVYWTLGTVVTVSVLLVGFGWFSNFKFHESEKQRLKDELDTRLNGALATIDTRLSSNEARVINLVDSRLDNHFSRVTRDIDIARSEASQMHEGNVIAINQLKNQVSDLEKAKILSQKNDSQIETELRWVEKYLWDLKGIPVNTLITQSQGLAAALKAENRYHIKSALEGMQETIEESILPKNEEVSSRVLNSIKERLNKAAEIEPIMVEAVGKLLEKIRVEPESNS